MLDNFDVGRGTTAQTGVTDVFLPELLDAVSRPQHATTSELTRLLSHRIDTIRRARDRQIVLSLVMSALAVVAMLLLSFLVNRPVRNLTRAMLALAGGNVNIQLDLVDRSDEVGAMSRAVTVFRDNAIRKQMLEARGHHGAEGQRTQARGAHQGARRSTGHGADRQLVMPARRAADRMV